MRIAHITDLHYSKKTNAWDFKNLFDALIESLLAEHHEKKIDLLLITGDLVDKGGSSFLPDNHYKILQDKILARLAAELELTNDRIIIIPGNHDVCEKKDDPNYFIKGLRNELDIPTINKLIEENLHDWKESAINGLKMYKEFERAFYSKDCDQATKIDHTNFETCFTFNFGKARVGVAAFNSAWNCNTELDREGKFKLGFGTSQVLRATQLFQEQKTDFNIALLHHPINMDMYSEQEETEMKTFLSNGNFGMLFCGHTHRAKDQYVRESDISYYLVVTKSSFNPREKQEPYKSGFSLLDLTYASDTEINVSRHFRKYILNKRFDFDVEEAIGGKSTFKLKPNRIGKNFVSYLKSQNDSFDPERKVLFETINSISQSYIKSPFPHVMDIALRRSIERFLPKSYEFNYIRKNLRLHWTIQPVDKDYHQFNESQSYQIVSTPDPFQLSYMIYVDTTLDGKDKTAIRLTEYAIDGRQIQDKAVRITEQLPRDDVYGKERQWLSLKAELKGRELYNINSKLEVVNSLATKKAWTLNRKHIVEGYEIIIDDPTGSYHIELFGIGSDIYYSNINKKAEKSKQIVISRPNEILIPGDEFWLFVSSY